MAYQITLTDDEYAALAAVAEQAGTTVEALVHEALDERLSRRAPDPLADHMRRVEHLSEEFPSPKRHMTDQEFIEQLYRDGIIANIPTGEPDTPEEEAELEELANQIGSDKPWLSDMVIEDRGPR